MKLAHCIHGLSIGGAQKIVATLVRGQNTSNIEQFVYTPSDGVLRAAIEDAGATVRIIPRSLPIMDPFWIQRLSKAMRDDQIDLVHCHLFGDCLHGYFASRRSGAIPIVVTLHSNRDRFLRRQQLGYSWLLNRCSAVVGCSESVCDSFVQAQPSLADKIQVVRNGIEAIVPSYQTPAVRSEVLSGLGIDEKSVLIASIGRLVEPKGQKYLIDAFHYLCRESAQPAQLLFVGDGPLRAELEQRVERRDLGGRVIFAGFRPDIQSILPCVDIVAFSSIHEGLSIALLEAMATSRAIVATTIPSFREGLGGEWTEFMVRPKDSDALGRALLRLTSDPQRRLVLGDAALIRFRDLFSAEAMIDGYTEVYRECLRKSNSSSVWPVSGQSSNDLTHIN